MPANERQCLSLPHRCRYRETGQHRLYHAVPIAVPTTMIADSVLAWNADLRIWHELSMELAITEEWMGTAGG